MPRKTSFQRTRAQLTETLVQACNDLDWQQDAEYFVRYKATCYERAIERGNIKQVDSILRVLTSNGPQGNKVITDCPIKTFGNSASQNLKNFYQEGQRFTTAIEALPLLVFTESEVIVKPKRDQTNESKKRQLILIAAAAIDGRITKAELEISRNETDHIIIAKGEFEFTTNVVDKPQLKLIDPLAQAFFNGWIDIAAQALLAQAPTPSERFILNMPAPAREGFLQQKEKFREKFGRDPRPTDPAFFDPNSDVPEPISEEEFLNIALSACKRAGIPENKAREFLKGIPNFKNTNRFNA
jgi:hypothetical protein